MFKSILNDEEEITNFIISISTDSIDKELIREYFYECKAILKYVPIESLEEGDPYQNVINKTKERHYIILPIETMPPLIVEDYKVTDGNHRLRAAKKNGIKNILIYDVVF